MIRMNKRQMLKTMRLMSNKAILQEAGRRGLALIDLPEEPYSNLARKEFVWAIAKTDWGRADIRPVNDDGRHQDIELKLMGRI